MQTETDKFRTAVETKIAALKSEAGDNWLLSDTLQKKAADRFIATAGQLNKMFKAAKLSDELTTALLADYLRVLTGVFNYGATREQMAEVCGSDNVPILQRKAIKAFPVSVFYFLLSTYNSLLETADNFEKMAKKPEGEPTAQNGGKYWAAALYTYLRETPRTANAAFAVHYLNKWGVYGEFSVYYENKIATPEQVDTFLKGSETEAHYSKFWNYYAVAKYELQATDDELNAITDPGAQEFLLYTPDDKGEQRKTQGTARKVADVWANYLNRELEKLKAEILPNKNDTQRVASVYTQLNKKTAYASKEQKDDEPVNLELFSPQLVVTKVPDERLQMLTFALNEIAHTREGKPNGRYTYYKTTPTELARFCTRAKEGHNVSAPEIAQAVGDLDRIHGIKFLYFSKNPETGVKEWTAAPIVDEVKSSGDEAGASFIEIGISNDLVTKDKENSYLVSGEIFIKSQMRMRGRVKTRVLFQIIYGNNKRWTDFIREVLGYEVVGNTGKTADELAIIGELTTFAREEWEATHGEGEPMDEQATNELNAKIAAALKKQRRNKSHNTGKVIKTQVLGGIGILLETRLIIGCYWQIASGKKYTLKDWDTPASWQTSEKLIFYWNKDYAQKALEQPTGNGQQLCLDI